MSSRSARVSSERPFYDEHADAYDALITDPVGPWIDAVHGRLVGAGLESASVLDVGCGTGRHAKAALERGHRVTLLDASARLLAIAKHRCPGSPAYHSDICSLDITASFDAITCRGVLNDLVLDEERDAALTSFAAHCRKGGTLFLDVRETAASRRRADGQQRHREAPLGDGATLRFSSRPTWEDGRVVVDERYELLQRDGTRAVHDYVFQMRPWERGEIQDRLNAAGFVDVQVLPGVGRRTNDRLFVTAVRAVEPGRPTRSSMP